MDDAPGKTERLSFNRGDHVEPGMRALVVRSVTVDVKLQYRKFDTTFMKHVFGEDHVNDLPIMTLAGVIDYDDTVTTVHELEEASG